MSLPWPANLTLPETSTIRPPHLEINSSGVRRWLSGLPYAHAQQLAEALLEQCQTLNHYTLPGAQRAAVMAAYREALAYLDEHLNDKQARKPQDLLYDRLGQLYQVLAIGYLQVLYDAIHARTLWSSGSLGTQALVSAMFCQLEQIQLAMHGYAPCPQACKTIHALYQLAENASWLTQAIPHPWREKATLTALQLYQTYLLLMLVDPYRFTVQEQQQLRTLIPYYAPHAEILPIDAHRPAVGHFLIDLSAESGLQPYVSLKAAGLPADRYRLLNNTALVHALETDAQKADVEQAGLLYRISRVWRLKPQRRVLRNQQRATVSGSFGLNNLYPLLGGLPLGAFDDNPGTHDIQAVGAYGFQNAAGPTVHTWHCEGSHQGGTMLYIPLPAPNFSVGQLVILRHHAQADWQLGVVRWQRALTNQLMAGIQFLPGGATPVALRYHNQTLMAISLPGQQLLAAKGIYQTARSLKLMRQPQWLEFIRVDRLVESSGHYERFCYSATQVLM